MFIAHGYGWEMAKDQLLRGKPSIILARESYKFVMSAVAASTFR